MSETPETPETPEGPGGGPVITAKRRSGRGLRIALAVSVALNLLILGLIGGAVIGAGGRNDGPDLRALGLGPFVRGLEREDRQSLRERIDRESLRGERRAVAMSLRGVQSALRAEPFDRAAAQAALSRSRAAAGALQAAGHGALLDQLVAMDAASRAALADRLERVLRRRMDR